MQTYGKTRLGIDVDLTDGFGLLIDQAGSLHVHNAFTLKNTSTNSHQESMNHLSFENSNAFIVLECVAKIAIVLAQ